MSSSWVRVSQCGAVKPSVTPMTSQQAQMVHGYLAVIRPRCWNISAASFAEFCRASSLARGSARCAARGNVRARRDSCESLQRGYALVIGNGGGLTIGNLTVNQATWQAREVKGFGENLRPLIAACGFAFAGICVCRGER